MPAQQTAGQTCERLIAINQTYLAGRFKHKDNCRECVQGKFKMALGNKGCQQVLVVAGASVVCCTAVQCLQSLFHVACTPPSKSKSMFESQENLMGCEKGLRLEDCTWMQVFVARIVSQSTRV